MHPLTYVFIAGLILLAAGPFIPSTFVFLLGLVIVMTVLTLATIAWLERLPS